MTDRKRWLAYFQRLDGAIIGRPLYPRGESVTMALREIGDIPTGAEYVVIHEVAVPGRRVPVWRESPKFADSSHWEEVG